MTTERIPPAEGTIEMEIPGDLYVGINVVRRHVVEFFYRASTQGLLAAGETPLAIFDCILLEPGGQRLGGLTLHDYVVLTDQHLITWGRGLNRDVVDKFDWGSIVLDKFGRRTPIEGVIKIAYNVKAVSGSKRRISIKTAQAADDDVNTGTVVGNAPGAVGGVMLYLDLMPIGDVRVCASMMHYLIKGSEAGVAGFKEQFRADILRSQQRMSNVNAILRPFYMDLGNGMLVEADTIRDLQTAAQTSPYRNPPSPYRNPRVNANRGEASAAALNKGNRPTDTMRGGSRSSTGAPAMGSEEEGPRLRETVRLNSGPIDRASKLEEYENRASGRASSSSRLTDSSGATVSERPRSVAPSAPRPERIAPAPRPARTVAPRPAPATRVPAARPQRTERVVTAGDVLDTPNTGPVAYNQRPVSIPITVAIPKALLNPYSLSRLARGLWIDPRNLVRNAGDLSQTAGAAFDVVGVVATDAEARSIAVGRVRDSAYGIFRDNIILHYTVWPFIKPILDLVLLPVESDLNVNRRRLQVRTAGVEIDTDDSDLEDLGAMTGADTSDIKPATASATHVPVTDASLPAASIEPTFPPSKLGDDLGPDTGSTKINLKK